MEARRSHRLAHEAPVQIHFASLSHLPGRCGEDDDARQLPLLHSCMAEREADHFGRPDGPGLGWRRVALRPNDHPMGPHLGHRYATPGVRICLRSTSRRASRLGTLA